MAKTHRRGAHAPQAPGRRGFMKCLAWGGTGLLWTMQGGVLRAQPMENGTSAAAAGDSPFSFVQLSDSHIGFHQAPNPDVKATLAEAVRKVNALATPPDFVLHTGDLTHLARPDEFDMARALMSGLKAPVFYVPGEHDTIGDNGRRFFDLFGARGARHGGYSFDHHGVHFVGLVNVVDLKPGGQGALGHDQLEWLEDDLAPLSGSTPVVVFAHMPMWPVYEQWGWGTEDSAQALAYLRRFGSVTVLNGHIHQIVQKVEGNVAFYTARSTAYPIPAPGTVSAPGPDASVPSDRLHDLIGVRNVRYVATSGRLAVTDATLASA
jgi:3',5'-cyclic AMP phosphodiesterase CpdA